jgi:hypothetical protein
VLSVTAVVPGDYNGNGVVDAADYTTYRDALGTNTTLPNDTTPGSVTTADYAVWQTNFGQGGPSPATAVPEPAAACLLVLGCAGFAAMRFQNRRHVAQEVAWPRTSTLTA